MDTHAKPLFPVEFLSDDPVVLSQAEDALQDAETLSKQNWLPEQVREWLRQGVRFFRDLDLTPNAVFINAVSLISDSTDLTADD